MAAHLDKIAITSSCDLEFLTASQPVFSDSNKLLTSTGIVSGAKGGTGVANTGKQITIGGNFTTSGSNDLTLTTTGSTNLTLPTSGTLLTTAVTSLTGTSNQIIASASTGPVTLSTPQDIATTSNVTFGSITSSNHDVSGTSFSAFSGNGLWFSKTNAPSNQKYWNIQPKDASLVLNVYDDAKSSVSEYVAFNRSGASLTGLDLSTHLNLLSTNLVIGGVSPGYLQVDSLTASLPLFTDSNKRLTNTGTVGVTKGGTGLSSTTQGGLLYADASNSITQLTKNTSSTRVLTNTGTNNNPAWAQADLTSAVTGVLPNANTTATSANTASAIVARDGSGNFSAGTATLTGITYNNSSFALTGPTLTENATIPPYTDLGYASTGPTITITATTTNPTKASGINFDVIFGHKVGNWAVLTYLYSQSNTTGAAAGSGDYLFALPSGYTFNTTIHPTQTTVPWNVDIDAASSGQYYNSLVGRGLASNSGTAEIVYPMVYSSTQFRLARTGATAAVQSGGFQLNSPAVAYRVELRFFI